MYGTSGIDIVLRILRALLARKRLIFITTVVPTLVSIIIVLLVDSTYESEALVNPPQDQSASVSGALQGLSGSMGGLFGSLLKGESSVDDCLNILHSTRFADLVIKRFDLETTYKFKRPGKKPKKYYHADVLKRFHKNATFKDTEEGAIRIAMRDTSAERSREMVAYMISTLDSLYTDIQRSAAQQRLKYVDDRLLMAERESKVLEDSLVAFQKGHNIIEPDVQARLVLQNVAQTEVRKGVLEEEMALEASLRSTTSAKYRDLSIQKRLVEQTLKRQLSGDASDSSTMMPPTQTLPALAAEYFRIERAYTVRLAVYKFLVQQVEMLKLDAEKNIQVISVIDPPWVNDKRISPKRRVVVESVFIFAFLFASAYVVAGEAWRKRRKENPELDRLVREIKAGLTKL